MRKLKVIVADDELDALEVLQNILVDSGIVEVLSLVSEANKVECAVNKLKPDVLFMDIEMPLINGLELLANLREYNHDLCVILVTAYDKYASEAIKHNVYSYLLKPVDRQELYQLLEKLHEQKQSKLLQQRQKLKLPVNDGYVFVLPEEIFMLKADGNYTKIMTSDETCYLSSYNMGRLLERLPEEDFLRINRSSVINATYLHKINKSNNTCIARLADKEMTLELSHSFIKSFNKRY